MKFNHLNVPTHWQNYWTRYPEGHTILEALIQWVSQVDSMVDNQNKLNGNVEQFRTEIDAFVARFDDRLQDEVTQTLQDWQSSGFLDVVISDALQWQLDDYITTNEQDKDLLTTQLGQISVNASLFGDLEGADARPVLQAAIDYAFSSGIKKVFIPSGDMHINSTHPTKTGVGLYIPKGVMLYGISPEETRIFTGVKLDTLILLEDALSVIKNLRIVGTNQSYVDDNAYYGFRLEQSSGYLLMENVNVQRFKVGFYGELYASVFTKCSFQQNELYGFHLKRGTSIVMNSVGVNGSERGYFYEEMNYSTFNSCYGEQCDIAFYMLGSASIVFNTCGSEFFNKILHVENGINIEAGSFYAGALGVGGNADLLHDFLFEFINTEGGHFYGVNFQYTGKKGVVRFENTRKFNFRFGRIIDYNARFVTSTINFLDEPGLTTSRNQTFYVDSVNGSDDNIGTSASLPLKSLSNLIKRLPKKIKHSYNIRIMKDVLETVAFENIEITNGGTLKLHTHDTAGANPTISGVNVYNCTGKIEFDQLDFTETIKLEHSNGTVFNRVNFLNEAENIRTLHSSIQIQNSVFSGAVGIYLDRLSQLYSSNNTGTTTKSIHAQGSLVFLNGTQATGSVVKTVGGQVFSNE